jgi:hypothetical protein
MSKRYEQTPRLNAAGVSTASILALIVAMAASLPVTAQAEYRCGVQSTPAERHACELAKGDTPDELRRFTDPAFSIYGLYFYDYVSAADVERWAAARGRMAQANAPADTRNGAPKPALAAR